MTATIVVMIIIGIIFIFVSYFISEKIASESQSKNEDLLTVDENYKFSDRELQIIKTKIEDVIARQAKDILYETNDSLASMANEKTMALGDYAVSVCDEIEKNHKEVMFLYSMLDDKQKELMETVKKVDEMKADINELLKQYEALPDLSKTAAFIDKAADDRKEEPKKEDVEEKRDYPKNSALDQLSALKQSYKEAVKENDTVSVSDTKKEDSEVKEKEESTASESEKTEHSESSVAQVEKTDTDTMEEVLVEDDDPFAEIDHTDIDFDDVMDKEFEEQDNSNDIILEMYRNGNSILDIAKQLGLGVGEVRLVIDLYQGE